MGKLKYLGILLLTALILGGTAVPFLSKEDAVEALSGSDFNTGRIIDDGVFFRPNDMSLAQIQQFLDSKVPECDTDGSEIYSGSTTRAQRGTSRGYPPPYTCLKDYRQTTVAKPYEAGLCNGYPAVNHSAADIIYSVAQSCGINPKVLLVLLQKEQSLVTDEWPWSVQYRSATGFACPDTAPCDAQYYGFFNQVYGAARQFKRYAQNPNSYNYIAGRNNFIQYSPDSGCGGSNVFIHNQATAGLYNYTPYQPNAGALANVTDSNSGGTAPCGAYGNRNFWWYYNRWFGSTTAFNGTISISAPLTASYASPLEANDLVTASFTVSNSASYSVHVGGLGICARLNGANFDFGFEHTVVLNPNSSRTISFSRRVDSAGTLKLFTCAYNDYIGWASDTYPSAVNASARQATLTVKENPFIASGVTFSPANPTIGQLVTATMTIRNVSDGPAPVTTAVVAMRDPAGRNVDFSPDQFLTIASGATYTYSKTQTFSNPGTYSFFIAGVRNGQWDTDYPSSVDSTIVRRGTLTVHDNPFLSAGVSLSPASPAAGQNTTATMTILNTSANPVNLSSLVIAARAPNGSNVDFSPDIDLAIPGNSSYTYSKTRAFSTPGNYTFFVSALRGTVWDSDYPKSVSGSIIRRGSFTVRENPLVTTGVSLSPDNPSAGQTVTATMSIRNESSSAVTIDSLVIAGRGPGGVNVDFPADESLTIPANSTYTYSKTRSFSTAGNHSFFIAALQGGTWSTNYPKSADGSIVRQQSLVVQ